MFEKFVENVTVNVVVLRTIVAAGLVNENAKDITKLMEAKERRKKEAEALRIARERQMEEIRNRYYQRFGTDYIK
jgi:hypothetical protein